MDNKETKKYESLRRKYELVTSEAYQDIRKLIIEELIEESASQNSNDIPVFLRLINRIDNWANDYTSFVAKRNKEKE